MRPAILAIGTSPLLAPTEMLAGFAYGGDADDFEPASARVELGEIRVLVSHFSGAGAAGAETDAVLEWANRVCLAPSLDYPMDTRISLCIAPAASNRAQFLEFAADHLAQIVTPALQGTLGLTLVDAVILYLQWSWQCAELAPHYAAGDWAAVLHAEILAVKGLILPALRAAIEAEKSKLCDSTGGLDELRAIFEYLHLVDLGFSEVNGLIREQALEDLCAEVVIESATLADPLPLGVDHSLDAAASLRINGERTDAVFQFTVDAGPAVSFRPDASRCCGRSNGLGEFTTVVRRVEDVAFELEVRAHLLLAMFVPALEQQGGGFALTQTPLRSETYLYRGAMELRARFPHTLPPGTPTDLNLLLIERNFLSDEVPVVGAVLTITVTGGTVDPVQVATNELGLAVSQITAAEDEDEVVVDIVATKNGAEIASKRVTAEVADEAIIVLLDRSSSAGVNAWGRNLSCHDEDSEEDTGLVESTVSATASITCSEERVVEAAFGTVHLTSNPGLQDGGRSMALTMSATASVRVTAEHSWLGAEAGATAMLWLNFEIQGGAMGFQVDAWHGAEEQRGGTFFMHLSGSTGSAFEWESDLYHGGPSSDFLRAGNLPPGFYSLVAVLHVGESRQVLTRDTATLNSNSTLTLTLGN